MVETQFQLPWWLESELKVCGGWWWWVVCKHISVLALAQILVGAGALGLV